MLEQPSQDELDKLFTSKTEAWLTLEGECFIDASKVTLELLGVPILSMFKSLHPSTISPEFQPDGQSSKEKSDKMFTLIFQYGYHRFKWQHIDLDGTPFDVEVTARTREENGHFYIDAYWKT